MTLENVVVGDDQTGTTLPGTLHNVVGDNVSGQVIPVGKIMLGAIGSNDGPVASGNPLPVTGTVAATQSGTFTVQPGNTANTTPWLASIHDGTNKASVRDLGSNDALNVSICDGSGNQITSFGGGTQYTEGDTDASITGTALMWEDAGNTLVAASAAKPLPVDIQDSTVAVTQSGTWNVTNVSGTVSLPTGASTSANQSTIIGHLDGVEGLLTTIDADTGNVATSTSSIDGKITACDTGSVTIAALPNEGQQTMANSISVAIASNQSAVPASQSGTWNVTNVSGTVSLPTGASTLAEQQSQTTSLQLLDDTVATTAAAIPTKGIAVSGTDGTNARVLKTDASGELQIDVLTLPNVTIGAAIPTGDNAIGRVKLTDGTDVADILDLTNSNPLTVAIVDGSGDQITSFGGGTQYTEDAAAAANPVGTAVNLIRQDTPATLTTTDGDNVAQRGTNYGAAYCQIVSSTGSFVDTFGGGTQYTEGDTDASITGTAMMMEGAGNTLVAAQGTAADGLLVNLGSNNDVTGTVTANAGTNLNTSALSLETTQSSVLTSVQLIDDTVQVLGTDTYTEATSKGLTIGAVRRDADTPLANTTNEFSPLITDANGYLKVEIFDGGGSHTVDGSVTANAGTNLNTSALALESGGNLAGAATSLAIMDDWDNAASDGCSISGDVAHDTADAGEPVKIGGVAVSGSASPTSVASGDRTRFIANQHGIPYGIGGHPNLITREYDFGTAAQTDVNLAAAVVAADERVYVTRFEAMCDNANSVAVSVRAGFGTANVPTASSSGVSGMIATHPGIAAGSGIICGNGAGIIAVGGAGEEPRLTSSAATSGNLHVLISYYVIDETP